MKTEVQSFHRLGSIRRFRQLSIEIGDVMNEAQVTLLVSKGEVQTDRSAAAHHPLRVAEFAISQSALDVEQRHKTASLMAVR